MTCKDCVHYEICNRVEKNIVFTNSSFEEVINSLISNCRHFKNKTNFVEVKRGEWVRVKKLNVAVNPYQHTCGICGKSYFDHNESNYPHCPFCGADMRKEGADNG